jgi:hypothetical protein
MKETLMQKKTSPKILLLLVDKNILNRILLQIYDTIHLTKFWHLILLNDGVKMEGNQSTHV